MIALAYLAQTAQLYQNRASKELGLEVHAIFNEVDGKATCDVHDKAGRGITMSLDCSLFAEDPYDYVPELTDAEWDLFLREVKPWRFNSVCEGCGTSDCEGC